jgi:hypothetical protein
LEVVFADVDSKVIADRRYNDSLPMLMKEEMKNAADEA